MNYEFEFLCLDKISEDIFKSFYSILKASLPAVEFRSEQNQRNLTKKRVYELLVCKENGKVIGAIAFWHLEDFIFIEHFVIDENFRSKGIGTKMLETIKNHFNSTVILEVELPYNEMNKRRIAFYERNGFNFNDFEYFQVPLNEGDEPLPLRIMSCPEKITKQEFEVIRQKLKNAVYNS